MKIDFFIVLFFLLFSHSDCFPGWTKVKSLVKTLPFPRGVFQVGSKIITVNADDTELIHVPEDSVQQDNESDFLESPTTTIEPTTLQTSTINPTTPEPSSVKPTKFVKSNIPVRFKSTTPLTTTHGPTKSAGLWNISGIIKYNTTLEANPDIGWDYN